MKLNFRPHTLKKSHFWKVDIPHFVFFFWKYLVCGLKFEISMHPLNPLYVTYSPYKYEVNRTKTHEIRATSIFSFFFPLTVFWKWKMLLFGNICSNELNPETDFERLISLVPTWSWCMWFLSGFKIQQSQKRKWCPVNFGKNAFICEDSNFSSKKIREFECETIFELRFKYFSPMRLTAQIFGKMWHHSCNDFFCWSCGVPRISLLAVM